MQKLFTRLGMCKGLVGLVSSLVGVGVLASALSCSPGLEKRDFNVNNTFNYPNVSSVSGDDVRRESDGVRESGEGMGEDEERKKLNDEFKKLDILIGNYLPVLGKRSLELAGLQGGYCVTKPWNRFEFDKAEKGAKFVPYYFNGFDLMPKKFFIEDELSEKVCYELGEMLKENTDFNLDNSRIYARTLIENGKVNFEVDVCLRYCVGEDKGVYFNRTCFPQPSNLDEMLDVARYIVDCQIRVNEFSIDVNGLEKLAEERDLRVSINDVDGLNSTRLVEISSDKGKPSDFRFLIKSPGDGEKEYKEPLKEKPFDYRKELGQRRVFGV